MEFKTLDGKTVRIELTASRYPVRARGMSKSNGQYSLGRQIKRIYPGYVLLEEFSIPGSRLSLDFFVPNAKIAFEFQGIQHDKFNKFFHQDSASFKRQKDRDEVKRGWCDLNDITLVEVRDEHITQEELRRLIINER